MKIKILTIPGTTTEHDVPDDATILSIWPLLRKIAHEARPGRITEIGPWHYKRPLALIDGDMVRLSALSHGSGPLPRPANTYLPTGLYYIEPVHVREISNCQCRQCAPFLYGPEPSKTFTVRYGNGPVHFVSYPPAVTVADMEQTFEHWRVEAGATTPHQLHINGLPSNDETYVIQHGDRLDFIEENI